MSAPQLLGHMLMLISWLEFLISLLTRTLPHPRVSRMANSITDMFKAGAYALAVTMIIFSVLWPYFKIIVTFLMWYLPTSRISPSSRGSVLSWLDALGKWSMSAQALAQMLTRSNPTSAPLAPHSRTITFSY